MDILDELNPEQKKAVTTTDGYVRVIAGAGSGKTKALTGRYVFLVREMSISANGILCVTFTNKAAEEMKRRIRKYLKDDDCSYICTFHSFCVKLLHEDIHVVNYPKMFSILDKEDQKDVLRLCYEKLGITLSDYSVKKSIDDIRGKKYCSPYIELVTSPNESKLIELFQNAEFESEKIFYAYLIEQKKSFALDFDDLMLFTLHILQKDESVRNKWQRRLQYIMVDEFQDVNLTQYSLVSILSEYHKNLFVVGDPDQTIYTWRGARPEFIVNFDKDFPNVKTILMEKNYRSNGDILSAANDLIRKNKMRIDKNLVPVLQTNGRPIYLYAIDPTAQAKWVVTKISALMEQGVPASDICILYRAHYLSRSIEEQMILEKIPYKIYNGVAFYARKEIKDVHAYMRFMLTKDDLSFRRIINTPRRKCGKKSISKLEKIAELNQYSLYDALLENMTMLFKGDALASIKSFVDLVDKYSDLADELLISEFMRGILHESGYEEMMQTQGDQERLDNLAELKQSIVRFENDAGEDVTVQDYLEHIALFSSGDDTDTDAVKIMTVHSAKGLEFPYVFVYELSEGVFPSSKANKKPAMEEERRLAYVAFTRAEKGLFLSSSAGYNRDYSFRRPSRFIFNAEKVNIDYEVELPQDVLEDATNYIVNNEKMLDLMESGYLPDSTRVSHKYFGDGTILRHNEQEMNYTIQFDTLETERTISIEAELIII